MRMSSAEHPWQAQAFGDAAAARRSALVLASYPVLLLLVILAAFVRYLWVALAMYCALLFALSCAARAFGAPPAADGGDEEARAGRGGLSAAAIAAAAPAFPYEPPATPAPRDCPVCLEAMKAGEPARRLPACAHAFHVGCIDMWLDSHATCPVCRCHVVPRKGGKEPPEGPALPSSTEPPLPPV